MNLYMSRDCPAGLEELCEGCFRECHSLSRVAFGEGHS